MLKIADCKKENNTKPIKKIYNDLFKFYYLLQGLALAFIIHLVKD